VLAESSRQIRAGQCVQMNGSEIAGRKRQGKASRALYDNHIAETGSVCASPELHARSACVGLRTCRQADRQTSSGVPHVGQQSDQLWREAEPRHGEANEGAAWRERRSGFARGGASDRRETGTLRFTRFPLSRSREPLRRPRCSRGCTADASVCVRAGASRWARCGGAALAVAGANAEARSDGQDRGEQRTASVTGA
jgi:hypothetical protein